MGVAVTNRRYRNKYRNEETDWLLGNTTDWQNLTFDCAFACEKVATFQKSIGFDPQNNITLNDQTSWGDYGIDVGDTVTIFYRGKTFNPDGSVYSNWVQNYDRTVLSMGGNSMKVDGADITNIGNGSGQITMLPYQTGGFMVYDAKIYINKKPQGIEITYGHIENASVDSGNLASFIDGTLTRLICMNTDTLMGWQDIEAIGNQSGMSIDSGKWIYLGQTGTHTHNFRISINYMISSLFEDLSNFENTEAPSVVFDAASLTDNFKIVGYPEWNNPNTKIQNLLSETKRLGNTGWFNENYNGLEDDFQVTNVEYFDNASGTPITALSYGSETLVKITIAGVQNIANGLTKCGFGFAWLTNDEQAYKENETPFHKNLRMNTGGGMETGSFAVSTFISPLTYQGYSPVAGEGMNVKNVRFQEVAGDIVFEGVFTPTPAFKNFIDSQDPDNRKYILFVSVADRTLVTNFSNRVTKLAEYSVMELYLPPLGEYDPMQIEFYEHPKDGGSASNQCSSDMIVEDDILAKVTFKVDITEDIPEAIQFTIESKDLITGEKEEFQKVKVNLSGYPTDGSGVPQWNHDEIRGFKLEAGNNKNWVKVQRYPAIDSGTEYGYVAYFGFKIRWEDWLLKSGLSPDFFKDGELNNGFNNDWFQALSTAGREFLFTVYTDVTIDGTAGRYVNEKPLPFRDYLSNPNITTEWKFYKDSDNTLLDAGTDPETGYPLGILLEDELVRVETTITRLTGTWSDLNSVYGVSCLEVFRGGGQFDFRQLSSIWGSEPDNPLIPLTGETNLKMTLISPTQIKFECLVEPSLLLDATKYKHSARIGCIF